MTESNYLVYEVLPDDSLNTICLKFDISKSALRSLNNLFDDIIFPGDKLIIPIIKEEDKIIKYLVTQYFPENDHKKRDGYLMYFSKNVKFSPTNTLKMPIQFELANLIQSEIVEKKYSQCEDNINTHTLVLRYHDNINSLDQNVSTLFFEGKQKDLQQFHEILQKSLPEDAKSSPSSEDISLKYPSLFKPKSMPKTMNPLLNRNSISIDFHSVILPFDDLLLIGQAFPYRFKISDWNLKYRLSKDGTTMISIFEKMRRHCGPAVLIIQTSLPIPHTQTPSISTHKSKPIESNLQDSLLPNDSVQIEPIIKPTHSEPIRNPNSIISESNSIKSESNSIKSESNSIRSESNVPYINHSLINTQPIVKFKPINSIPSEPNSNINNFTTKRRRSHSFKRKAAYQTIGAFLPFGLKRSDSYYGNGETFVFTFYPTFQIYQWSTINSFFTLANSSGICIGGPEAAIYIDDSLYDGFTSPSLTFNSPQLTSQNHFTIIDLEIYAI